MTLVLGVIAITPATAGGTQDREVTHHVELVDFQPLDAGDESMTEESGDRGGTAVDPPMQESDDQNGTAVDPPMQESDDQNGTAADPPMQESDDQDGTAADPPMEDTGEQSAAADQAFEYENCDAARDAGAAPVTPEEYGFGPHLDRDSDGVGCEEYFRAPEAPEAPEDSLYQNCDAARDAGQESIKEGEPGYAPHLDADNDGVACEDFGAAQVPEDE
ncbi:excalibur calcium-binding domain-containing protein [Glycomyces algeriensis]|uniref:Excalibur calcium-binding domain-containing protein n=1 Tax=Glycomyces algeriensis TaxID=256037 RepID=A0A9W6GBB3_9ACTN|nr:excalibur calcium-binding domain-containing protein [Glycomyces algeriensis]MDA1365482.1 excalibur calcium-binding domain-containing protein [Glycomyces algeriensis]MDR7351168.1 hypothetical protein [Glycomyces algeriensis]GLI43881.1 hypothetical protein GALLR39Z86_37310 [Glycomyces algeriensis]